MITAADFVWQIDDPLARCKGESIRANQALHDSYLNDWSIRKQLSAYQSQQQEYHDDSTKRPPTTKFNTLEVWSRTYHWQERKIRQAELDMAADKAVWDKRRQDVRVADWQAGENLRDLFLKIMAESPQFIKTKRKFIPGKNGEPDKEIIIMALNGDLAVKAVKAASDLQRLASGEPTGRIEVNVAALTDEQLERIAKGEHPLSVLATPSTGGA